MFAVRTQITASMLCILSVRMNAIKPARHMYWPLSDAQGILQLNTKAQNIGELKITEGNLG